MSETENSEKNIISLKFGLEKHNFEEYVGQQRAYQTGIEKFDQRFSGLPSELHLNLRHEAGMSEVFKEKKELLKYSFHMYRQIEIIYSIVFNGEKNIKKIHDKIDWTNKPSFWYKTMKNKMIAYSNGADYLGLNEKNKNFLFKNIFYYEPKSNPKKLRGYSSEITKAGKIYLNAFDSIHYYRNLGSHNNTDNNKLNVHRGDKSEHKYLDNPECILDSQYFQRYVDMVILLYIRHLQEPFY